MQMIPSQPLPTNSHAELCVFDQLRSSFSGADKNTWFAMHSLRLPKHEYKRFGEIDFIVCGPDGIFVLEVKGGNVACRDGIWETGNRLGTTRLRESPFAQAEGALHGLRKKLPTSLGSAFRVGYGVVTPDVSRLPDSAEWDRAVLADGRDFKQFEKWFLRFIRHWRAKDPNKPDATAAQLSELRQHLRPDFESVISLNASTRDVETRIARLTEDQLRLIDVVEANSRVVCYGGAGTGKTLLAIELAKRWGASGTTTALACHSPWLKSFLERKVVPGLTVTLADSIHVAARRAGIDKFDALIVDEGQDILNMDTLSHLDVHLKGGLSDGSWCFFHDSNNQTGLCGSYVPDAYEYLESLSPVSIPLRTNCRNTLPILQKLQSELDADIGNSGVGDGPAIREIQVADSDAAIRALQKEIHELVETEGFNSGDIVVLSPLPYSRSLDGTLAQRMGTSILVFDDSSPGNLSRRTIGFAQIADFKGLESEVIILIDMPKPGKDKDLCSLHYVGMSRARALLSMIYS